MLKDDYGNYGISTANAMLDRERLGKPNPLLPEVPTPLPRIAYHGLFREIVDKISPHTESNDEALLVHGLIVISSLLGRGSRFNISGTDHHPHDFAVLVGKSGKARKGTSAGYWNNLLKQTYPDIVSDDGKKITQWEEEKGIVSTAGLIKAVIDPKYDKDGNIIQQGVSDKRKFFYESEFAKVIKTIQNPTNTAGETMKDAWDGHSLKSLIKDEGRGADKATDPHISIMAHITPTEYKFVTKDILFANGFGNRWLHIRAFKKQSLPEGGGMPEWGNIPERLKAAIDRANENPREIKRTPDAKQLWASIYDELCDTPEGFVGALQGRSEAHALRIQLILASFAGTDIDPDIVMASIAIVQYSNQTIRHLFWDNEDTGQKVADKILNFLKHQGRPTSVSEINEFCFGKNDWDHRHIGYLMDNGLVGEIIDNPNGKSKPLYYAKSIRQDENTNTNTVNTVTT